MKLTEGRLADIVAAVGDDIYRLKNAFRLAGIEIVPDPEPELPPREWRVYFEGPNDAGTNFVGVESLSGGGNLVRCVYEQGEFHSAARAYSALRSLVSAYNAGERKRIEIHSDRHSYGPWLVNEERQPTDVGPNTALGMYVRAHASDLGLEIVEL